MKLDVFGGPHFTNPVTYSLAKSHFHYTYLNSYFYLLRSLLKISDTAKETTDKVKLKRLNHTTTWTATSFKSYSVCQVGKVLV